MGAVWGGVNDRGTARRAGNVTPGPDWTSLHLGYVIPRSVESGVLVTMVTSTWLSPYCDVQS